MGDVGALSGEHLLILQRYAWPDSWHDGLRQAFPDLKITTLVTDSINKPIEECVPKEALAEATIIALGSYHLPLPESVPKIKFVHTFSAGADHVVNEPYIKADLAFTTSSGIHGAPISEWVLLNWLVEAKHYNRLYEAQKAHDWISSEYLHFGTSDQVGKRVGILGYGSIGRQIGRVAVAMGMQVIAYTASAHDTPESRKDDGYIVPGTGDADGSLPIEWHHGTTKEELRHFLSTNNLDHVVISVPLTPATTNLFGKEEFDAWSSSLPDSRKGFLTNIARGKIVNTDALIDAVRNKKIRGAALDVTDPEPLPKDHPLWDVEGIQISPHISGIGVEYYIRSLDVLKANIERLQKGEDLINLFRRKRGY